MSFQSKDFDKGSIENDTNIANHTPIFTACLSSLVPKNKFLDQLSLFTFIAKLS